ncbi:MAG: acetylxylan esterase [Akkermansiaceae bacterium]|nr:acetylxylan esterase [Akkermansiaceae bacterium]
MSERRKVKSEVIVFDGWLLLCHRHPDYVGGNFQLFPAYLMKFPTYLNACRVCGWIVVMSLISGSVCEGGLSSDREKLEALAQLTDAPAMEEATDFDSSEELKAIYFKGLAYEGKPTKVFAWLGMPKSKAGKAGKVTAMLPAVVLVHGGGGTAFKDWVERWNARGYAAISIAVEGQTDIRTEDGESWSKHQWAGPSRVGIYGDAAKPIEDQWMYHAVADTILAHSLIRSLPGVDSNKVGLMGISWGGIITSTVMGIDGRFAFAIPTYGCGDLAEVPNQYGKSLGNKATYKEVYDPMLRFERVKMPTLWFSWPQDKHFPMDKFANSYKAVSGPYAVSLIPKLGHGHGPPWNKPDSYAFADSIIENGQPWCTQKSLEREGDKLVVIFESAQELGSPVLVYSTDEGITGGRTWHERAAKGTKNGNTYKVQAKLPEGVTGWFVNVKSGELTMSSDYQE